MEEKINKKKNVCHTGDYNGNFSSHPGKLSLDVVDNNCANPSVKPRLEPIGRVVIIRKTPLHRRQDIECLYICIGMIYV